MAKPRKIDGVPPTMPIDWRAWESSPLIQNMSDAQLGIALKIMLKQWVLGSLPHNAYRMANVLQSRYETVRKFLQTYPKFVVCSEHGCSWDVVGMECECTADVATVVCQKTKNFYIDVNSGLPLGTTEPNRTYIEPKGTDTIAVSEGVEVSNPLKASGNTSVRELVLEEDEEKPNMVSEINPSLTSTFETYLGRRIKGADRDLANEYFDKLVEEHSKEEILQVMNYAFKMNDRYGPSLKMTKKRSAALMFLEEYESIKIAMETDAERKEIATRRAAAIAPGSGHALKNPELHTGLDAQGKSWTEDATKI